MAEGRQRGQGHGDHIGRQTAPVAGRQADHFGTKGVVVDQQAGRGAARIQIGPRQRLHPQHGEIGGRRVIADGTRGAGGRARPAACADHRINAHVVAVGCDCPRRAQVQTVGAGGLPRAAVGAQQRFGAHIQGLFKRADQMRRGQHGGGDGRRMGRIGAQIPLAFLVGGEQRLLLLPAHIKDHVAVADRAVLRGGIGQVATATGHDLAQRVNRDLEVPQRALGLAQGATDHVKRAGVGQGLRRVGQQGDGKVVFQLVRGLHRGLAVAQDQTQPFGCHIQRLLQRGVQQRLGCQRGHFGQFRRWVIGPTGPVAQVQQGGRGHPQFLGQFGEDPRFLGAAENCITCGQCGGGTVDLAGAQRRTGGRDRMAKGVGKCCGIDALRTLTITCYQRLCHDFSLAGRAISGGSRTAIRPQARRLSTPPTTAILRGQGCRARRRAMPHSSIHIM